MDATNPVQLFDWMKLTETINNIVPPNTFVRDTFFSNVKTHGTKVIQIDLIVGKRKIAPFVRRGAPAIVVDKLGQKTSFVEPPSIRLKKELDPEDLIFTRQPGAGVYVVGNEGDAIQKAQQAKIAEELKDLQDRSIRTEEWMSCQALAGGFSYSGDDFSFTIDFQMPSANKPTLEGGKKWDQYETATPLADIRAWKKLIQQKTGITPTKATMTEDIFECAMKCDEVKEWCKQHNFKRGEVKTHENVFKGGAEKVATIDNVEWYVYNEQYTDKEGVDQNMIPADRFVLAATTSKNVRHYGAIHDLKAGAKVKAQYFSKMFEQDDPSALWLLIDTHPLPTPHQPETIVYAKVK